MSAIRLRDPRIIVATCVFLAAIFPAGNSDGNPEQYAETPDSLILEARVMMRAYDYEGALKAVERAVGLDPLHVEAHSLLRSLHGRIGSRLDFAPRYHQLLRQYPNSAAAYYLMSTVARDLDLAKSYLLQALRLDPAFAPALLAISNHYERENNPQAALEWTRRAVELRPGDYGSVSAYVWRLKELGRTTEAISFLKQMTARFPEELRFWTQLWRTQLEETKERDISPISASIEANRYRFMESMEDMERLADLLRFGGPRGRELAADLYLDIVERFPDHPHAEKLLTDAARAAQGADLKIEILTKLVEDYPHSSLRYTAYQDMIRALIREQRFDEAINLSKSLLHTEDPGYREGGAARSLSSVFSWGKSFECVAHMGWLVAAQRQIGEREPTVGMGLSSRLLDGVEGRVSPQTAAAGQSLRDSMCRESAPLLVAGQVLVLAGSYRSLGVELLELAFAAAVVDRSTGVRPQDGMLLAYVDFTRSEIPYLYLQEGRLDDAVSAVETFAATGNRGSSFHRIAGLVYEAAGRLHEAKAHYLRATTSGRRGAEVARALARIYAALASSELEILDAESAVQLPIRQVRVHLPELEAVVPLRRMIDADLTLVVFWTHRFSESMRHLGSLVAIERSFGDAGVSTLAFGAASRASSLLRHLEDNPTPGRVVAGVFEDLDTLGVEDLPSTYLVDRSGRLIARQMSYGVEPGMWLKAWTEVIETQLREIAASQ